MPGCECIRIGIRTSSGTSAAVTTSRTSGSARARLASIDDDRRVSVRAAQDRGVGRAREV